MAGRDIGPLRCLDGTLLWEASPTTGVETFYPPPRRSASALGQLLSPSWSEAETSVRAALSAKTSLDLSAELITEVQDSERPDCFVFLTVATLDYLAGDHLHQLVIGPIRFLPRGQIVAEVIPFIYVDGRDALDIAERTEVMEKRGDPLYLIFEYSEEASETAPEGTDAFRAVLARKDMFDPTGLSFVPLEPERAFGLLAIDGACYTDNDSVAAWEGIQACRGGTGPVSPMARPGRYRVATSTSDTTSAPPPKRLKRSRFGQGRGLDGPNGPNDESGDDRDSSDNGDSGPVFEGEDTLAARRFAAKRARRQAEDARAKWEASSLWGRPPTVQVVPPWLAATAALSYLGSSADAGPATASVGSLATQILTQDAMEAAVAPNSWPADGVWVCEQDPPVFETDPETGETWQVMRQVDVNVANAGGAESAVTPYSTLQGLDVGQNMTCWGKWDAPDARGYSESSTRIRGRLDDADNDGEPDRIAAAGRLPYIGNTFAVVDHANYQKGVLDREDRYQREQARRAALPHCPRDGSPAVKDSECQRGIIVGATQDAAAAPANARIYTSADPERPLQAGKKYVNVGPRSQQQYKRPRASIKWPGHRRYGKDGDRVRVTKYGQNPQ